MGRIYQFQVEASDAGQRLDRFLTTSITALSRTAVQRLIKDGDVTVGGELSSAKHRVRVDDRISVKIPDPKPAKPEPQDMNLRFLYRDEDLVVVDMWKLEEDYYWKQILV